MEIMLTDGYDAETFTPSTSDASSDQDYGCLHFRPGSDDSFRVAGYGDGFTLSVSLYEARRLIEVLQPLAALEDAS